MSRLMILKNLNGDTTIDTNFRGKRIIMKPKHSIVSIDGKMKSFFDREKEEERALTDHLLQNYKFVVDITQRIMLEKGGEFFGKS